MKELILNADDFGLTEGVNEGIIRAHREGVLTSTTLMANAPAFDDAVQRARANRELGVGCHLVLAGGPPVAARYQSWMAPAVMNAVPLFDAMCSNVSRKSAIRCGTPMING